MAINIYCSRSDCKFYWECMCMKNVNEEPMEINENGKCMTFENGISDWYEESEKESNLTDF